MIASARAYVITRASGKSSENRRLAMMHVTYDGKRIYVSNSLLSTLDHAGRFYVRLVHIGPDGMKVEPFFNIDLNHFKTGPARGHDMLLN
jgi:selenium-binding protein 1